MGNHVGPRRRDSAVRRDSSTARTGLSTDIVLRCAPRSWWRSGIELSIVEPAGTGAGSGLLFEKDAPDAWTVEHEYYSGESDVQPLIRWLHESLGDELLRTIAELAGDGPARLFITAEKADEALLGTPWEVLERSTPDFSNVRVIRSLRLQPRSGGADDIGVSLRVLATWANPSDDIPDLDQHRRWLEALPKTTDSAVEVRVVEFIDTNTVRDAMKEFHPNVVYHFGHADAIGNNKVALRIGASGRPQPLDGAAYAELLRQFSPRILALNACSTITGRSLSPYIGLSSECMAACESVVCMQAEVGVGAAKRFGEALLFELADNAPLSHAVRQGRREMAREHVAPFTRFIPVLFTRKHTDPAFAVNTDELNHVRIQKRLAVDIQKVKPLLARDADASIDTLLNEANGVALITGPASSGKSTTIRGRIAALTEETATARLLYRSVEGTTWVADPAHRVRQVLNIFVSHFQWLTRSLASMLNEGSDMNAPRAVAELATWLKERAQAGRRTVLIADDMPEDIASELVSLAANAAINDGLLVVVTRAAQVDPQLDDVHRIEIPFMSEAEIGSAEILKRTGGMPYFVASIRRGHPLDGSQLDERIQAAPESAKQVLRLAAYATMPLSRAWLERSDDVAPLVVDHLLIESQSGERLTLPDVVRDRVRKEFAGDELALRITLFGFFDDVSPEMPRNPVDRELAYDAWSEAMRQALALALQTRDAEWLEGARDIALDLHHIAMRQAGDAIAARAAWEMYRDVAHELGKSWDRKVDAPFAEALAATGEIRVADDLLDAVIAANEPDKLHVGALILRSNVLKQLGECGAFAERVQLLQHAEALAERLIAENPDNKELLGELLEMLGNVEQSLGNALGYGSHAQIADAERHVNRAVEIFDELGDPRIHRARTELIEIRRYNGLLSEADRVQAIASIDRRRQELQADSMRRDQIFHLYELGRLEVDPEARAKWFRRAYERAAGSFSPLDLHAALQWRMAELEMGKDVEAELAEVAAKLERFAESSWSLRLRRDALRVLANRAFARDEETTGTDWLRGALTIAHQFQKKCEGRRDAEIRSALEEEGGRHGLRG